MHNIINVWGYTEIVHNLRNENVEAYGISFQLQK